MAAKEKNATELEKAKQLEHVPWCEEYEKMISGMLYDSTLPELANARFRARQFSHSYNSTFPPAATDFDTLLSPRAAHLRSILGHVGDDEILIEPPFYIDYGCNIRVGARFYANFNCTILDCALVTIGDRVMFGPGVQVLAATHETDVTSRRANIEYAKPITIGDDVWVGANAVILPGVTVGEGCTIGAQSVVTRDVPAWSVVLGSPARVVRTVEPVPKAQ